MSGHEARINLRIVRMGDWTGRGSESSKSSDPMSTALMEPDRFVLRMIKIYGATASDGPSLIFSDLGSRVAP